MSDCTARTPEDVPRFELAESAGCGDVFVFKKNAEGSEFLIVDADVAELGIERGASATFGLERPAAGLAVRVDVYAEPPLAPEYCNDFVTAERPIARWTAVDGSVTITLSEWDGVASADRPPATYRAVLLLEDLTLEDEGGRRVSARSPIQITAEVGWLAG